MPGPLILAGLGAALGLGKSFAFDQPREEKDKKLAGAIARWSPWTGMQPGKIRRADPFGSALQGGTTGFLMGGGKSKLKSLLSGSKETGGIDLPLTRGGEEAGNFAKKLMSGEELSGQERMLLDSLSSEERRLMGDLKEGGEAHKFGGRVFGGAELSGQDEMLLDSLSSEEKELLAGFREKNRSSWMGV